MNPERHHEAPRGVEAANEALARLGRERFESLGTHSERSETAATERAEAAREALARHHEEGAAPEASAPTAAQRPAFSLKLEQLVNYRQTVQSLQRRLGPASRQFSRVIHNDAVDRASDVAAKTVGRPSVIAGALWGAALIGLGFYLAAKHYGYGLSGSELIIALMLGGIVGLGLEMVVRATRHRP